MECLKSLSSQLSSSWDHGHHEVSFLFGLSALFHFTIMGLPLKACLQGRKVLVGPTEHSEVHENDTSHYSNKSVYFANTNIPLRDRSADVLARSGLQAHKAEHLTSDTEKLLGRKPWGLLLSPPFAPYIFLLENFCRSDFTSFWPLRHHFLINWGYFIIHFPLVFQNAKLRLDHLLPDWPWTRQWVPQNCGFPTDKTGRLISLFF